MSECSIPEEFMKEMRSSVFLAGALLARCGEAVITSPGGCDIGRRPIDIHIKGLESMGARMEKRDGRMIIKGPLLKGTKIRLKYPSVGATENIMLAATGAEGVTVIENSAREPEIEDLQKYINRCGGRISGAGTGKDRDRGREAADRMLPQDYGRQNRGGNIYAYGSRDRRMYIFKKYRTVTYGVSRKISEGWRMGYILPGKHHNSKRKRRPQRLLLFHGSLSRISHGSSSSDGGFSGCKRERL